MFVAGLVFLCAAIDGRVGREEVPGSRLANDVETRFWYCRVHGVQAYSSQFAGDDFDGEPATLLELMSLGLRYEAAPDVEIFHCPSIWPAGEDVVRHDVVVAKSRYNGYYKVAGSSTRFGSSEDIDKLRDHELILVDNLLACPWQFFVVVMARRVASPYDEVDFILDVVLYPLERLVDQGVGRVAI